MVQFFNRLAGRILYQGWLIMTHRDALTMQGIAGDASSYPTGRLRDLYGL